MKEAIKNGKTALGIEFGSTRIKAVLVDQDNNLIAVGNHDWENRLENNIWTYSLNDIWNGLQDCYQNLAENVRNNYGITIEFYPETGALLIKSVGKEKKIL
jgi:sugar (pentulose or hexulose) kinase